MIYLDYNASTPVDPKVREAMLPFLGERFGNPSSSHALGKTVKRAVDEARTKVAAMLDADPSEIVFTSGGTESNNHVIKGVAFSLKHRGRHIITSAIEHPAVINPCRYLEQNGYRVSYVPVDSTGQVDPEVVIDEIRPDTILISIMHANNEVGSIQPIAEIAMAASRRGVLMHTDAAQSCGKIPTNVSELGIDFLSIAGHKMYAPQGIGALYIRRGIKIEPLHHGAGHESGRRAGTEAVANIVGLGKAAELAAKSVNDPQIKRLRDRLHSGIREMAGDDAVLLGHPDQRLPNTSAIGFRGKLGADILSSCPDICASTGAACHAEERKWSDVLKAMDVPEDVAFGAIRFSVGRFTTESGIDAAVDQITNALSHAKC